MSNGSIEEFIAGKSGVWVKVIEDELDSAGVSFKELRRIPRNMSGSRFVINNDVDRAMVMGNGDALWFTLRKSDVVSDAFRLYVLKRSDAFKDPFVVTGGSFKLLTKGAGDAHDEFVRVEIPIADPEESKVKQIARFVSKYGKPSRKA